MVEGINPFMRGGGVTFAREAALFSGRTGSGGGTNLSSLFRPLKKLIKSQLSQGLGMVT